MKRNTRKNQQEQRTDPTVRRLLLLSLGFLFAVVFLTVDVLFSPGDVGGRRVIVPDFCGGDASLAESYEWLDVTVEYRHDDKLPAGTVISQAPSAGVGRKLTAEHPHCPLTLYVSLGAATAHLTDVVGMPEREAALRLREAGFTVTIERKESSYPEGKVYEMDPLPEVELPRGSEVRLTVSAGIPRQEVLVPALQGKQRSEALVELWMAKLTVLEVVEEDSLRPAGEVLRQSPLPGTRVSAGSGVRIYVSRGRTEPTTQ